MIFYGCLNTIMALGKQIRIHRIARGLTLEQLSDRSGVDVGTISALENRDSQRSAYAAKIANAMGMTFEQLDLPPTSPAPLGSKLIPVQVAQSDNPDLQEVRRVKFKLSAGISGFVIEPEEGDSKPVFFRKDWFADKGYRGDKLFAVRVTGASMEPSLWDGDLVVINTADIQPKDGEAYALNFEGEMVIKRMRRDAGEWFAASDNADQRRFSPKRCTEEVKIIGRVVYKQSERI